LTGRTVASASGSSADARIGAHLLSLPPLRGLDGAFWGVPFSAIRHPNGVQPAWLVRCLRSVELIAAAGALISGVLGLVFVIGNMSGTINGAIDRDTVWSVLHDTDFGRVWSGRLALASGVLG